MTKPPKRPCARRRDKLAFGLLVATLTTAPRARAEDSPADEVVVIGGGAAFREAVSIALSPWQLHVVASDEPPPSSVVPRASRDARAMAERHSVGSVVWVSSDVEPALFVYERKSDQLLARALAHGPPFDAPTAASVALTVKTMLRSSEIAPRDERVGAAPHDHAPIETERRPPPLVVSPARLRVDVTGAARTIGAGVDARIGVGASYWLGDERRLGLGLGLLAGPGLGVETAQFRGRFDEIAASPTLRVRAAIVQSLTLEPRIGTTLHLTQIDGVTMKNPTAATRSRADASIDVGAMLAVELGKSNGGSSAFVGLDLSASYMLRYQSYLVLSERVFELSPFQGALGLRFGVGLL